MNRTILKDPQTGKTEVVYESRKTSAQFWTSLIAQILAIAVVVFGAAKFGLKTETREVIADELTPPTGIIYNGIHSCAEEHIQPIAEEIKELDKKIAINQTVQKEIRSDIGEIKDAVKEIAENGS